MVYWVCIFPAVSFLFLTLLQSQLPAAGPREHGVALYPIPASSLLPSRSLDWVPFSLPVKELKGKEKDLGHIG